MDKTTPMKGKPLVDVTCKLGVKGCYEDGRCHALGSCENKIVTNADRIRAMSDEELARYTLDSYAYPLCDVKCANKKDNSPCNGWCYEGVLEWLKQPADHFREATKTAEE